MAFATVIFIKKFAGKRLFVGGRTQKMSAKRRLWIEVSVDLRWHPKLISSAKSLNIPKVYLEGHLVSLWSGALEYAEDGDLWRGDDDSSLRFFESLAEIPAEPQRFLDVLRLDRWLDGWLIHDWLDHAAKYLIARYSSHNRERLVEITMPRQKKNTSAEPIIPVLPREGFVRLPVILHVLGVCKTSFYLGIRDGKFPAPIKIGPRTSVWRVEDIRAIIAKVAHENGVGA